MKKLNRKESLILAVKEELKAKKAFLHPRLLEQLANSIDLTRHYDIQVVRSPKDASDWLLLPNYWELSRTPKVTTEKETETEYESLFGEIEPGEDYWNGETRIKTQPFFKKHKPFTGTITQRQYCTVNGYSEYDETVYYLVIYVPYNSYARCAKETLKELKTIKIDKDEKGFYVKDKYVEGYELSFTDTDAETAFCAELLECRQAVKRNDDKAIGNVCWNIFDALHPEWDSDDQQSLSHTGGGFYSLPTVQICNGGTILFIAQSQVERLKKHPWVCKWQWSEASKKLYFAANQADVLVVVPDKQIHAPIK